MSKFKQENIYAYNALKANKIALDKEESFLVSTLLHLESELEYGGLLPADFSERLMKCLNYSESLPELDRVCLSITHPGSSRISVLSSFNSNRIKDNIMEPGYSCYVSTESSLFGTKKTNIRIYSNINDIISLYDKKPVQRSLGKLASMGIVSGITIPLNVSNLISGFLFLNSSREGAFNNLRDSSHTILCFVKLIALSCINKRFFGNSGVDSYLGTVLKQLKQKQNIFLKSSFEENLLLLLKTRFHRDYSIETTCNVEDAFFYPLAPILYTYVKYLEHCSDAITDIVLTIEKKQGEGKEQICFLFKGASISMEQMVNLQDIGVFTNSDIGMEDGSFFVKFDFDPALENVDYSI